MNHSCFIRKIDELGRIVLPIEIRKTLNIKEKDSINISLMDNGVFLQKREPSCIFCGTTVNLFVVSDKFICKKCLNNIKNTH